MCGEGVGWHTESGGGRRGGSGGGEEIQSTESSINQLKNMR